MKQFYLLLVAGLFAFAATAQDATIPKFPDGAGPEFKELLPGVIPAEWQKVPAWEIIVPDDAPAGQSFQGGTVRVAYNDTALMFLTDGINEPFRHEWVTNKADWESDRTEHFVSVNPERQSEKGADPSEGQGHEYGFYQFVTRFEANDAEDGPEPSILEFNHTQWPEEQPLHRALVADDATGEWTWWLIVPFTSLTVWDPEAGDEGEDVAWSGEMGSLFDYSLQQNGCLGEEDGFDRTHYYINPNDRDAFDDDHDGTWEAAWGSFEYTGIVALGAELITTEQPPTSNIAEVKAQKLSVFPNPAQGFININLEKDTDVRILNVTGSVVEVINYNVGQRINIETLPAGVYFIKADDYVGKFIKQ